MKLLSVNFKDLAPNNIPTCTGTNCDDKLNSLVGNALIWLMIIAVVIGLLMLLWSGIEWILSSGDKAKIEKARGRITYTIIGLVVVFLAIFIVNIIGGLFGVDMLVGNSTP